MRRAAVAWAAALVISCGLLALPVVALAATSAVTIQNSAFAPASVTVKVGDTVTWTNRDALSHTSTSDTGAWDTAVITTGASRSFTFASAGTFGYHCSIHAFMKGTVIVQAASTPPPPPPTAPPTPVRTAPPTLPPTAPPTTEPAEAATASPTASATTSPSVSPAPSAANSPTASASPSAVAEQLAPPPASAAGPAPLLIAGAAIAIVVLGAIAFLLARRS